MNEPNQPLRELFDNIDGAELAAMKDRREEESLNLDFKRMDPSGEPSSDDKKNLREAISGYANAAGGIILWGVESKAPDDRRDRSRFQSLVPVRDGDRAAVRFHELTATATQPPVSGVVHKAIPVEGGFVVKTFVPASDGGPHRTNEVNGQYFRRDADAFRAMQHHEIADMFGRRLRPRLKLALSAPRPMSDHYRSGVKAEFILSLENIGRGLAKFPRVLLDPVSDCTDTARYGLDGNGNVNLRREHVPERSASIIFTAGSDDVVHPGGAIQLTKIGIIPRAELSPFVATIRYKLFAEGMVPVDGELQLRAEDLVPAR